MSMLIFIPGFSCNIYHERTSGPLLIFRPIWCNYISTFAFFFFFKYHYSDSAISISGDITVDLLRCRVASRDACFCLSEHQVCFFVSEESLSPSISITPQKKPSLVFFFCGYQFMLRNRGKRNYWETSGLKPVKGSDWEPKGKAISSPIK